MDNLINKARVLKKLNSNQEKVLVIDNKTVDDVVEILEFYKDQVELVYKKESKKKSPKFDLISELIEESQRVGDLIKILKK